MKSVLLFLLFISACSFKKSGLENQTQAGHNQLYSITEAPKKTPEGFKRVVIAATNDIHSNYVANEVTFKDSHHEKQQVMIGGADIMAAYFKIMRQQFGKILLADSGGLFAQKIKNHSETRLFYELLGYDALTIGTQDFNVKLPSKYKNTADFFKSFSEESATPLLLSNLYELKSGRLVEWKGTRPYLIKEVNGVKVGIIGIIPDDLVKSTPLDSRIGWYVDSMLQSTLRHARLVRSLGAEIVVVLTHQGISCGDQLAKDLNLPLTKVNFEPQKNDVCDLNGEMGEYLKRLPPKLVDVVIGGRHHQKMANFVNTTLVLSSFPNGEGFSMVEFFVDEKSRKVDVNRTIVHQPVMFCREFFKETDDCYMIDPSVDHKVRTEAKFLGLPVLPDPEIEKKFTPRPKTTLRQLSPQVLQRIVDEQQADIAYYAKSSGDSKLMLLTISGKELIGILEQDYNHGDKHRWQPSPFMLKDQSLILTAKGNDLAPGQTYKILIGIDDLQEHPLLKKFLLLEGNQSLNHVSWNEPSIVSDDVSSAMAASQTVR